MTLSRRTLNILVSISIISAPFRCLSFLQRRIVCFSEHSLFRTTLSSNDQSTTTSVQYQLENVFKIPVFISNSNSVKLEGVFVLEDINDNTLIVESSVDVRAEVESIISTYPEEKFSKIRVQTFPSNDIALLAAYKAELVSQTNPKISNYKAKTIIQSPFDSGSRPPLSPPQQQQQPQPQQQQEGELELTVENVNRVLDEVRPYLVADGGNVAVVSVDPRTRGISLALQGACGSCASSTVYIHTYIHTYIHIYIHKNQMHTYILSYIHT